MRKFINEFRQSWRNGQNIGDSRWFIIKMALRGKLLHDDAYREFIDGLLRIECCDECKESVKTMTGEQQ
jgi:hypothetical protein